MDFKKLYHFLEKEPSYRLKQVKKFLFQELISDWDTATSLPLSLREKLKKEFPFENKPQFFASKEKNNVRALFSLRDRLKIESVLIQHKDGRNTVCVSSQAGCPLGCLFCATGSIGFKRNLDSFEIIQQVLFFARYLKERQQKVTNVVFMGMGEPFLNYDNVLEAVKTLNDKEGFGLGSRRISISTIGIVEGIRKLADENLQVNLAVSLHAPNNELRSRIMPVNRKYPIESVFDAVDEYIKKTKRRVMIEYILIDNLNDSDKCARKLSLIAKRKLFFVNLISCNPIGKFKPSKRMKAFKSILEEEGISATQRHLFGDDIEAACGQLAGRESKRT